MAVAHDRRVSSAVGSVLQPSLSQPYTSPRPASRIGTSTDAAKYLRRSRGSSSLWLAERCGSIDLDDNDDDEFGGALTVRGCQTARAPRVSGEEASEIFRRSQGSLGTLLNEKNQIGYSSPRPQPRLPSGEAEANARRSAGLFQPPDSSNGQSSMQPQRVRIMSAEATANAARNAGSMKKLMNTEDRPRTSDVKAVRNKSALSLCLDQAGRSGADLSTPPPRPRVKPEAENNARKNAGSTCKAVMAGKLPGDPVRDVRASGAGLANYEVSRSGSVGALFAAYAQQSTSAGGLAERSPERIPDGPGREIAKHGKTGTLCHLMNNYGNMGRSPRPASRLRSEGRRYVYRNRGNNMANCLNPRARSAKKSIKRKTL